MYKSLEIRPQKLFFLCFMGICLGIVSSIVAKALILAIAFFTNLSYFHTISFAEVELVDLPAAVWHIFVPIAGGLIVGLMARYGSSGIRGHGIPEVMETILLKESKIPRRLTLLKPLSAAIAIGTGGPFGAEGPIIATGSSLGSWIGRHFIFNQQERKVLLATGAAAGMTAIFGTPLAAILICIELLLFEFSVKSFLPVAVAVVTAQVIRLTSGHVEPVFPVGNLGEVTALNTLFYCLAGFLTGALACFVSQLIFKLEHFFEKSKIHWMWWPALGGIFIGVIGYIEPRSLGVGYSNITHALQGSFTMQAATAVLLWKFASWVIALSSGTSGGTLAPLLTLGSCFGIILGMVGQDLLPSAAISLPTMALICMSAMFSGATRAVLTSTAFAIEATGAYAGTSPLLVSNCAAYLVSILLMKETIMTEKISKRGVRVPMEYFSVKES